MEKLIKPAEYARELGISRQAVYAKIKRGILTAKNIEGKLYIVLDRKVDNKAADSKKEITPEPKKPRARRSMKTNRSAPKDNMRDYRALLDAKDETISVLKGAVKDLKKSNEQISTTLKGEIDLLKDAFYEMRTLYVHQLEQKKSQEAIEVLTEEDTVMVVDERWIGVKKFFKRHTIVKKKRQKKVMKRLRKAYKSKDKRLKKSSGKLKLNANKTYSDILK